MERRGKEHEELRADVERLQQEVARLQAKRRGLANWQRVMIGFAVVAAVMLLSIGVLQFIKGH